MKTKEVTTKDDMIVIAFLVAILGVAFVLFSDIFSIYWKLVFIVSSLLSFACGMVGKTRKIGFAKAFFIAFLFSPIIGFVFALSSPRIADAEYQQKMIEIAEGQVQTVSVADQLYKLNELRKDGVLTEDEFAAQKERLLNL